MIRNKSGPLQLSPALRSASSDAAVPPDMNAGVYTGGLVAICHVASEIFCRGGCTATSGVVIRKDADRQLELEQ